MAQAANLPNNLTEDERQWIHWRMDWLCAQFSEALLQNAKVALPNSNHFPNLFSAGKGKKKDLEQAQEYLRLLCRWMDFDSSVTIARAISS